jgi:hypothetical protein
MTTTIDTPGLAKAAPGDLLRELTNERARVKRRLDKAKAKLAGHQGTERKPTTVFATGRLRAHLRTVGT